MGYQLRALLIETTGAIKTTAYRSKTGWRSPQPILKCTPMYRSELPQKRP
jgi:hypothetical protein